MKAPLKIAALIVALVIAASAQTPAKWITYTSADGRYTVDLPAQPDVAKQDAKDNDGDPMVQFTASASQGDSLFEVAYFDFSTSKTYNFDAGRDGMLKATNGTLISERPITLGDAPGREVKLLAVNATTSIIARSRFYVIGTRVYIVACVYVKDSEGPAIDATAKKFVDSFTAKRSN